MRFTPIPDEDPAKQAAWVPEGVGQREEVTKTYPYPHETNNLADTGLIGPTTDQRVYWTDPDLAKITRLRLLSDSLTRVWDVSYCWGELKDGTIVRVQLPFSQLRKVGRSGVDRAQIVQYAQTDKLYVKRLGIFTAISTCY